MSDGPKFSAAECVWLMERGFTIDDYAMSATIAGATVHLIKSIDGTAVIGIGLPDGQEIGGRTWLAAAVAMSQARD